MLLTSKQLKALVRKRSMGDSNKALIIFRNFVMERFLERLSLSPYRDHLILKGGIIVAAVLGLDNRSTLDLDVAIKGLPLSVSMTTKIVEEIISTPLNDGIIFNINTATTIMDDADYTGVRLILDAVLENMHTPLKIDFSTGDVITPIEIAGSFALMFENRRISVQTYNLETLLSEKLETVISRGTANTRMRDFYDIYALTTIHPEIIDPKIIHDAFTNTCQKRGLFVSINEVLLIFDEVETSSKMTGLWQNYQKKYDYAEKAAWNEVMRSVRDLYKIASTDESGLK